MSKFIPNKDHLRMALISCSHLKKTVAESQRLLLEAYGEDASSQDTCERWLRRFESGDIDIRQEGRQKTQENVKKFDDLKL